MTRRPVPVRLTPEELEFVYAKVVNHWGGYPNEDERRTADSIAAKLRAAYNTGLVVDRG